eukprot:m.899348 g.899348  ORF g.899348 m.899348 type:complete len:68 (+) comp23679_c0_seq20:649-852(+)
MCVTNTAAVRDAVLVHPVMVNPFAIGPFSGLLVPFIHEKRRQLITHDALVLDDTAKFWVPWCGVRVR